MRRCVVVAAALLVGASSTGPVSRLDTEPARLLNRWFEEGSATGNRGDWYDNRDRAHSSLDVADYPQLEVIRYTEAQKSQNLDMGLQREIVPGKVVIGNSSTSAGVEEGGSNARTYYFGGPPALDFLYAQYRSNQLYVYPEHRDHDLGRNGSPGYGDLFPMNAPYLVISQGSSFNDMAFVEAFVQTLASFRRNVKNQLVSAGLLMPTLQQIFRRSNQGIETDADYLSGKAHPTVFPGGRIDALKMVEAAHAMRLRDVPPLVQLGAREEKIAVNGRDFFEPSGDETLADTPCAIARVFRRHDATMRMVVSAEQSADPFGKPLSYHWKLLRGNPEHVTITTMKNGALAEIVVRWPEWRRIAAGPRIGSNRVDVGVFVHNGRTYSAPGFVSVVGLDNELRTFDAEGRISEIDYHARDMRFELPHVKDVARTAAFFDVAGNPREEFARRLLASSLDPAALETLVRTSRSYAPIAERFREAAGKIEKRDQKLADAVERAKWELDHAGRGAAREEARRVYKAARAAQRGGDPEREAQERILDEAKNESAELIADSRLMKKLSAAFTELAARPDLYAKNRKEADRAAGKRFKAALERATALGFQATDPPSRPTEMEREQLRYLNQLLLADVFPDFLLVGNGARFTDPRVTVPKDWRDTFYYDAKGRQIGWTRFHRGRAVEYTAHGHMVLEKDDRGRPRRARAVSYVLARDKTLAIEPTDRVFRYEYPSEDDRLGTPRPERGG